MDKPMSDISFKFMSLAFKFRDLFINPADILKETGIKSGDIILDYGCGPGSYTIAAARMVSDSGKIYALDIHPTAIDRVRKSALKLNITNIETIQSDCATGLPDASIDIALLYDIVHGLDEPLGIFAELHRVLRSDGILSVSDHHLKDSDIKTTITDPGLFRLSRRGEKTYNFSKIPRSQDS